MRDRLGMVDAEQLEDVPVGVLAVDEAARRVAADRLDREPRAAARRLDPRERLRHVVDRHREVHDPDRRLLLRRDRHDRGEKLPELERVRLERDVAHLDLGPRPEDRLDVGAFDG